MGDINAELLRNILARNAATGASQPQNPWDAPPGQVMPQPASPMPPQQAPQPMDMGPAPPPSGPIADPVMMAQMLEEQKRKLAQPGLVQRLATLLGR